MNVLGFSKKAIATISMVVAVLAQLCAWQNTYNAQSREFNLTKASFRIAGQAMPIATAPVTGSQLEGLLGSLDMEADGGDYGIGVVYGRLLEGLSLPSRTFSYDDDVFAVVRPTINPQVFVHSNDDATVIDWEYPYRDWLPILDFEAGFCLGSNFYGLIDLNLTTRVSKIGYGVVFINLLKEFADFELALPRKAYASIGNDGLSFVIGRDRVEAGNGMTGNLMVGDGHWWNDFAKLSVLKHPFSYDFTLMSFDTYKDYNKDPLWLEQFDYNSPHRLVAIHRFSMAPFKWMSFAVAEGMLQYGTNLFGDFEMLNPFMLLHGTNGYVRGNQNNFFGVELSFVPCNGLELNLSVMFDQIQVATELDDGQPWSYSPPNAYGALANAIYSTAALAGVVTYHVEFVYTSPCLYLKEDGKGYDHWDTNLIVGNVLWDDGDSDLSYLGYKYGPDTVALGIGADYVDLDGLAFGGSVLFRAHGEHGIRYYDNQHDTVELGPVHFRDVSPTYTQGATLPELRLSVSTYAEYALFSDLDVKANLAFVHAWNYRNEIDRNMLDVQLAVGVSYHPPY